MASWQGLVEVAPEFAARLQARFQAHKHVLVATLRADGSPRLSGTEVTFADGELWLGSMPDSMKGKDLRRDPRLALHSAPVDLELADGDAKLNGVAHLITDPDVQAAFVAHLSDGHSDGENPGPPDVFDLFRVDVTDASIVVVSGDHLDIDRWHAGGEVERTSRR
jgi:hypothetical protein